MSKRTITMALSLMLALSAAAFGTVAYMTDSDTVINTFTVGSIDIIVDETNVDGIPGEDGSITPSRDQQNSYELIPGKEHKKDPRVTIPAGSEECYVRMRVEMNCYAALKNINQALTDEELLTQFVAPIHTDWKLTGTPKITDDKITYEYRYKEAVNASQAQQVLEPLFNTFTVPLTFTGSDLKALSAGGFYLTVTGDAIQTEAFASANAAWKAYDEQNGSVNMQPGDNEVEIPAVGEQDAVQDDVQDEEAPLADSVNDVVTDPIVPEDENDDPTGTEAE